jgi:hypothetical protein
MVTHKKKALQLVPCVAKGKGGEVGGVNKIGVGERKSARTPGKFLYDGSLNRALDFVCGKNG